jgi:ABC-type multidrug transport system ATPase subunit
MALLLGPPSSGKTTLLLALAGKLDPKLKVRTLKLTLTHTRAQLRTSYIIYGFNESRELKYETVSYFSSLLSTLYR